MKDVLKGKTIVVGITGSIAAYKTLPIIEKLKKAGAQVHVIMTESASKLVDRKTVEKVSGNAVHTELFLEDFDYHKALADNSHMPHMSLADSADLILVCPATANIIAKVAHGLADELLTTTILATNAPVVFAPAMNVKMWMNSATQRNIMLLRPPKIPGLPIFSFVDPEYGELACGYEGVGRLANPNKIIDKIEQILSQSTRLRGKKVIVTAGGTSENLDDVRVITNRSSGKMGAALVQSVSMAGADVVLIRTNTAVRPDVFVKEIQVESSDEMMSALEKEMKGANIVIHCAAVSDFKPEERVDGKRKSNTPWELSLVQTTKILHQLKQLNPNCYVVCFKAESTSSNDELIDRAYKTLVDTDADLIVANDISQKDRGFESDMNEVTIIDRQKKITHVPLATKMKIGAQIVEYIINLNHEL